jgi:biopolymer transport protein ExbD
MATDNAAKPANPWAARLAGKKAIRSYARKLADPEDIKDLNITPMMDMMTIILVFLLKSFTSSAALVNMDQNLSLPPSLTMAPPKQAVAITITKRIVLIDGEAICPITGGRVDPQLKRDGDNGYYITPLVEMLSKIATREKKIAELTGQKFDGELTIIADRGTPYRLLTEILYSCGQAEYANYRLLVLKSRE